LRARSAARAAESSAAASASVTMTLYLGGCNERDRGRQKMLKDFLSAVTAHVLPEQGTGLRGIARERGDGAGAGQPWAAVQPGPASEMTRRGDPERSTGPERAVPATVIVACLAELVSDALHLVRSFRDRAAGRPGDEEVVNQGAGWTSPGAWAGPRLPRPRGLARAFPSRTGRSSQVSGPRRAAIRRWAPSQAEHRLYWARHARRRQRSRRIGSWRGSCRSKTDHPSGDQIRAAARSAGRARLLHRAGHGTDRASMAGRPGSSATIMTCGETARPPRHSGAGG